MDEFITAIRQNVENSMNSAKKISKYTELLRIVLANNSEIKILNNKCNEEGDIEFEVPLYSIGLNYGKLQQYKSDISATFMINFLGELFVREHMEKFVNILTELRGNYLARVNKYEHRKFGMRLASDKLIFSFHSSLIQNILTSDLKQFFCHE